MDKVRRRPRETLLAFDPLSAPSPSKPQSQPLPSSRAGLHALAEHPADIAEEDDDEDDDQSFFSALGNDGFPAEGGGLVGELVQTSPERSSLDEQHRQHVDLLSWDSPVKTSPADRPLAGPATPSALAKALAVPLPDSPPASSNSVFDFLAPTPRPASKLLSLAAPPSTSALAHAQTVPLPESPPRRHRDVMDWLADTPMPASRKRGPDPDRSVRFDHGRDTTVLLAADADVSASFEGLPRTSPAGASRTGTAASATDLTPAAQQHDAQASPERTTLLPSAPSWDDDGDDDGEIDLMRTPAPKKVRQFAFVRASGAAEDVSTFPSPPSSSPSSPTSTLASAPALSKAPVPEPAEQTAFLPYVPDLSSADESYADLLSTPAPKRVQSQAADVSIWPAQPNVDDLGLSVSSTATVAPLSSGSNADDDQAEKTTFLPAVPSCLDESYDDLMSTPAPRRVKVFASADISVFPSPPSASPPSAPSFVAEESHPAAEHDKTTFLPAVPADLDESYADLLTTPAPSRVSSFAPDVSAFPSPLSALGLGASTTSSASDSSASTTETEVAAPHDDGDQTGFWPVLGSGVPDDSFDDLMTTPAPRRVKQLSISPPPGAASAAPQAAAADVAPGRSTSPSLEERFGYLLASTRAAPPRTPVTTSSRASSSASAAASQPPAAPDTSADETFDLDALAGAGGLVGDETFDLLSTPLPSLAQSRTANFPRASTSPPTSSASPSAGRGEPADETLVLDSKAFDDQDDGLSFSLLTGGGPAAGDDDEGDGWGLEEERALERLMGSDSAFDQAPSAPPGSNITLKRTSLSPPPRRSNALPPAATPLRTGPRQAVPASASATGSTLRRTSSAISRTTPRTSSVVRAPASATPTAAATPSHRRSSSVASVAVGREASAGERSLGRTPSTLRRTSSVAAAFARDTATPSVAERTPARVASSAFLRRTSQVAPAATAHMPSAAAVTSSHARTSSLSVRQPRTSIGPAPAAYSATPARSLHRRTSSVPAITGSTQLPRTSTRAPVAGGRTPLVGPNPSVNAPPPTSSADDPTATRLKHMSARIQTLNKKDGTRSLDSSLSRPAVDGGALAMSGGSSASLSILSERVTSSRLQSRSLYALPGASNGSAATNASRLPRDPSLASGIRAPSSSSSSSAASKGASGATGAKAAPTLESVRAALASLEARRRK